MMREAWAWPQVPSSAAKLPLQRRICGACGRPLVGKQVEWCSDHCRWEAWDKANPRQRALPGLRPEPPVQDQRVPVGERRRLGGMSARIVELLRQRGVITNREFAEEFPPGAAWRTRVSDARLWLEQRGETIRSHTQPGGLAMYWLEDKP